MTCTSIFVLLTLLGLVMCNPCIHIMPDNSTYDLSPLQKLADSGNADSHPVLKKIPIDFCDSEFGLEYLDPDNPSDGIKFKLNESILIEIRCDQSITDGMLEQVTLQESTSSSTITTIIIKSISGCKKFAPPELNEWFIMLIVVGILSVVIAIYLLHAASEETGVAPQVSLNMFSPAQAIASLLVKTMNCIKSMRSRTTTNILPDYERQHGSNTKSDSNTIADHRIQL